MIPGQRLNPNLFNSSIIPPDNYVRDKLTRDRDTKFDGSVWMCEVQGGRSVVLYPHSDPQAQVEVFAFAGITEVSLAFDRLGQPLIAYVRAGQIYLYWFNSFTSSFEHKPIPGSMPYLTLDDRRDNQTTSYDVVLFYAQQGKLYHRLLRDRFETPYFSCDVPEGATHIAVAGLNNLYRFELVFAGY